MLRQCFIGTEAMLIWQKTLPAVPPSPLAKPFYLTHSALLPTVSWQQAYEEVGEYTEANRGWDSFSELIDE